MAGGGHLAGGMRAEAWVRPLKDMKDKTRTALDEARILVLGIQVTVGFEYQAVFQKNFSNLPEVSQNLKITALILMLIALGFIMSPAPYNQIVEHDNEDPRYLRFITVVVGIALLPFALGLGGDVYVAVQQVAGTAPGIVAGAVAILFALILWYGLEIVQGKLRRRRHRTSSKRPIKTLIRGRICNPSRSRRR